MNEITFSTNLSSYYRENQVLTRQEAKLRLHKLAPGSEEFNALQNTLIKTNGIATIYLSNTIYKVDCCSNECKLLGGFGPSEHIAIGKEVKLQFPKKDKNKEEDKDKDEVPPLFYRGHTAVRFEDIVALAGDFYGIAGQAISLPGGDFKEKKERFHNAFMTLYESDNNELRKILLEINDECHAVHNSSLPHHCYSSLLMDQGNAIQKIKKDVPALLQDNSDHFYKQAQDAYIIGHVYALSVAREAGEKEDEEMLKKAYAIEAFACHFLTDLFSAGHIRNQRGDLETFLVNELKFEKKWAKPLAGLLTGAQHEKDGNDGLNVSNERGDRWRAYGDGSFFLPKNKDNKKLAIEATQASIDEIYDAYSNPKKYSDLDDYKSKILKLIPTPTSFNPLPLYTIEDTSTLILHQIKGESLKITNKDWKFSYLKDGICHQALKYLPENYINSYIKSYINPFGNDNQIPVLEKVFIPQIERITGHVWHVIGISTYHQVKKENEKLNEKIDEMASVVNEIYKNTSEILDVVKMNQDLLKKIIWQEKFKSVSESIRTIKTQVKKCDDLSPNEDQKKKTAKILYGEMCNLSTQLENPCEILTAYGEQLKENISDKIQRKIAVTLWFRHILGYQATAFHLYETIQMTRNEDISGQRSGFEKNWMNQIKKANEGEHIDEGLIYYPPQYIKLQIEKQKVKMQAIECFKSIDYK